MISKVGIEKYCDVSQIGQGLAERDTFHLVLQLIMI